MTQPKSGLGEQAINKIAEMALASQLDEAEKLQVDVKIDRNNLAKGEVDSLTIEGEGLVTPQNLRLEELEMHINRIAVNPLNALFGKIQLTKPTEGTARVVLTDTDINRALNSETGSTNSLMSVSINGQPVLIDIPQVECRLQADGKLALNAQVVLSKTGEKRQLAFSATPRISTSKTGVVLQDIQYIKGTELSPEITAALVEKASEILNLRSFELEGISLSIHQLDVEAGRLTIFATAAIAQFPKG